MDKQRRDDLASVFLEATTTDDMSTLLDELLTSSELEALALRITLVRKLLLGQTQRQIAAEHHISLCKITRGSKIIKNKDSVIKGILERRIEDSKSSR